MDEHFLSDDGPVDAEMIRRWAYDPDCDLAQQDEDLLLHDWDFAEVLLELAADPGCPKADYVMGIWDYFTQQSTVHQRPGDLSEVRRAVEIALKHSDVPAIKRWIEDQTTRLSLVDGIGPVTRETALQMGNALLNGVARSCPIAVRAETRNTFEIELSVPGYAHREWLSVNKATGKFRYSRYWPQGAAEPHWFDPNR